MPRRLPLWFRLSRWALVAATVLFVLIWLATAPFYYFASIGQNHAVRVEGGRINWKHHPAGVASSTGIDINSEPMRWSISYDFGSDGSWDVTVPVWIGVGSCGSAAAAMFVLPRRRRRGHCRCGYPLGGLTAAQEAVVCPECGRKNQVRLPPREQRP